MARHGGAAIAVVVSSVPVPGTTSRTPSAARTALGGPLSHPGQRSGFPALPGRLPVKSLPLYPLDPGRSPGQVCSRAMLHDGGQCEARGERDRGALSVMPCGSARFSPEPAPSWRRRMSRRSSRHRLRLLLPLCIDVVRRWEEGQLRLRAETAPRGRSRLPTHLFAVAICSSSLTSDCGHSTGDGRTVGVRVNLKFKLTHYRSNWPLTQAGRQRRSVYRSFAAAQSAGEGVPARRAGRVPPARRDTAPASRSVRRSPPRPGKGQARPCCRWCESAAWRWPA